MPARFAAVFTTCQIALGVIPAPQTLPRRLTRRKVRPRLMPAAVVHTSTARFTHAGTGTVRMCFGLDAIPAAFLAHMFTQQLSGFEIEQADEQLVPLHAQHAPARFPAAAQRHHEQPGAPILAGLGIAHRRARAVIDWRLLAGSGDDHHASFRCLRAPQLAYKALHALGAAGEAVLGNHVLVDRHSIAATAESQFDGLAIRLAGAGAGTALWDATGAEERAPTSSRWEGLRSVITSESVITSLAGFEVAFDFPFGEGFSGLILGLPLQLGTTAMAGFSAPKSVITSFGRFCRSPPPTTGRSHRNPRRFQVLTGSCTTDARSLLDLPQRPAQPSQS
jgi:hypothetical protein